MTKKSHNGGEHRASRWMSGRHATASWCNADTSSTRRWRLNQSEFNEQLDRRQEFAMKMSPHRCFLAIKWKPRRRPRNTSLAFAKRIDRFFWWVSTTSATFDLWLVIRMMNNPTDDGLHFYVFPQIEDEKVLRITASLSEQLSSPDPRVAPSSAPSHRSLFALRDAPLSPGSDQISGYLARCCLASITRRPASSRR